MRISATVARAVVMMISMIAASSARAGAWVQPKGDGQIIVKYEDMRADEAFDPDGILRSLPADRQDLSVGVFAEYGLTDRLTLQVKADWQNGEDAFVDYQGRGPIEVGVVWQAWRSDRGAVSLQTSYISAGEGRNAGYDAPGEGDRDLEVRASAGWSFTGKKPKSRLRAWLSPGRSFVELQVARRMRAGLPDETRADLTLGRHLNDAWMVLNQTYAGETEHREVRWVQTETSVVRRLGSWSLQAGWRTSTSGRETPLSSGPVLAVWRRF